MVSGWVVNIIVLLAGLGWCSRGGVAVQWQWLYNIPVWSSVLHRCNTADLYHMSELQSNLPAVHYMSSSPAREAAPKSVIISKAPQFDGKIGLW